MPPTARLGHGSGQRVRAEIVAILLVGLAVVALGLGLGGPTDEPTSSADATDLAVASASASASATAASPGPCVPVPRPDTPRIRLWSTSDDRTPVLGVQIADEKPFSAPSDDWPVPAVSGAVLLPAEATLVVFGEDEACLASVEAFAARVGGEPPGAEVEPVDVAVASGPDDEVRLGGLPEGDWVVLVDAQFEPGNASSRTYFRVISGPVRELVPSPQVTPAVACPADPLDAEPDLVLVVGDGDPVAWQDVAEVGPIPVRLGDRVEVRAIGDACARSWSVSVADDLGNSLLQESYPNAVDNPFEAAQNRWHVGQLLVGASVVQATVGFGRGRELAASWPIEVSTPPLPTLFVEGPGGDGVMLLPGCGQYWDLGPAGNAFQPCDRQSLPEAMGTLTVRDGEIVRLVAADGTIEEWGLRCGDAVADFVEPSPVDEAEPVFRTRDDCNLGEGTGPTAAFLPWPGESILFAGVAVDRGGLTVYGNYFARLIVEP